MPKITSASVAEHKEAVGLRLFDAFAELLAEQGYERLTLRDVAERAGLARTAIYNYHRDKAALLLAWSTHRMERFMRLLDRELDGVDEPREQLRIVVVTVLSEFALTAAGTQGLAATLPPEQRSAVMNHVDPIHQVLHDIVLRGMASGDFRHDQDPRVAADMILACLDTQRLRLSEGAELSAAAARVLPFITLGVSGRDHDPR